MPKLYRPALALSDKVGLYNVNLVEAMGVEPMSALHETSSATCLAFAYTFIPTRKLDQNERRLRNTVTTTQPKSLVVAALSGVIRVGQLIGALSSTTGFMPC